MNTLQLALTDTLDLLLELQRDAVQPAAARTRMQDLRDRHPSLTVNLLSEIEVYDKTVHYDALLRAGDGGTVSISYCADKATPWPLLGVHRWSDSDLLRVNAHVLKVDEAIAFLDFVWDHAPIATQLINQCIIREELANRPIELSDDELQAAVDRFRLTKKLFTSAETDRWLEKNGMTIESLERFVSDNLLIEKLRDRVTMDLVENTFEQRRGDFDTAKVTQFALVDSKIAEHLALLISKGEMDFGTAAQQSFIEGNSIDLPQSCEYFATVERRQCEAELGRRIFSARPGQLVGPVPVGQCHLLVCVLAIMPAELSERVRAAIKHQLFEEWLVEKRSVARIEWCWGNAQKTQTGR